nr:MAG TPA: hypothetical protein [Caudoviricetes sp.]
MRWPLRSRDCNRPQRYFSPVGESLRGFAF